MKEKDIEKVKLLGRYEFALKRNDIIMIISSVIFFVGGIVSFITYLSIFWCGFIFIGFGVLTLVYLLVLRKYIIKKINFLKEELKDEIK